MTVAVRDAPEGFDARLRAALLAGAPGTAAMSIGRSVRGAATGEILATGALRETTLPAESDPTAASTLLDGFLPSETVIGSVSYEAGHLFEPAAPRPAHGDTTLPLASFLAFDQAELRPLATMRGDRYGRIDAPAGSTAAANPEELAALGELDRAAYVDRVRAMQRDIAAGEYYEINFTQRFRVVSAAPPGAVALILRTPSVPPCWAYIAFRDRVIVSASPELFLRRRADRVVTKPIKGSAPRGATPADDRARIAALRASLKDAAEHTMVVDLARNDLGRVARYGTVRTRARAAIETFPAIHHMVATVTARLRGGYATSNSGILAATYPAASITGAPKVRVMAAIAEYEVSPRGAYCGALGRFTARGPLDLAVAIRTATARPRADGTWLYEWGAGGAIVADSDPDAEYDECLMKAAPMLAAIRAAE